MLLSCSNRPKEILDISDMTDVLVDMHIADGIFDSKETPFIDEKQKANYYASVLEKHNITQAEFDSSLVWYSHDPKKFERIYSRVIAQLEKRDGEVKAGKFISTAPEDPVSTYAFQNLWRDSTLYDLKKRKTRKHISFTIKDSTYLLYKDKYTLRFLHRIDPKDSCTNTHAELCIFYSDGKIDSVQQTTTNDGEMRSYTLQLTASRELKIDSLTGTILASDSCFTSQYAYVDSISLKHEFNPSVRDTIKVQIKDIEVLRQYPHILLKFPREESKIDFTDK